MNIILETIPFAGKEYKVKCKNINKLQQNCTELYEEIETSSFVTVIERALISCLGSKMI